MEEIWQLYGEDGKPLAGQGATKKEVRRGLLHAASHVWIYRRVANGLEILVQKRAAGKATWPNCLDISAAGHIDLDETPLEAAIRETQEEIGLSVALADLKPIGVHKTYLEAGNGIIENEFQFLYLLELAKSLNFSLQAAEVDSLIWKSLSEFKRDVSQGADNYVPHGNVYYSKILDALAKV